MEINRINAMLAASTDSILSAESFSERIDVVYGLLDKAFPKTSTIAAVYGSITNLGDYMSRAEIEPLLQVLKKSSKTGDEFVTTDEELNLVLEHIYELVKK